MVAYRRSWQYRCRCSGANAATPSTAEDDRLTNSVSRYSDRLCDGYICRNVDHDADAHAVVEPGVDATANFLGNSDS